MKQNLLLALAFLVLLASGAPRDAAAQPTTLIRYTPLTISTYGSGKPQYYVATTDAAITAAWTLILSTHQIGTIDVLDAQELSGTDTTAIKNGQYSVLDNYQRSKDATFPYKVANTFTQANATSGLPAALLRFSKTSIAVTDTGITYLGTPQANFIVTAITIRTLDTSGYTSNATIKLGSNASSYNNLFATGSPTLGSTSPVSLTPATTRPVVASGTPIYFYVTTAAVATSEHVNITVMGFYE